jgi:hypothetical protein
LGLQQGAASAAQDAALALSLDQSLGATARVLADLRLLAQAHTALGNADQARHYARLAQQAQDAVRALQTAAP